MKRFYFYCGEIFDENNALIQWVEGTTESESDVTPTAVYNTIRMSIANTLSVDSNQVRMRHFHRI